MPGKSELVSEYHWLTNSDFLINEKFTPGIFSTPTAFETLNQVLGRLKKRKAELLKVLDKPELPLHNNASEQDIREFVTKRAYQW